MTPQSCTPEDLAPTTNSSASLRRADEPAATIEQAFNQVPNAIDWDTLSEASQARAYKLGFEDTRIENLIAYRDEIEADPSYDQEVVRDVQMVVFRYIISRFETLT